MQPLNSSNALDPWLSPSILTTTSSQRQSKEDYGSSVMPLMLGTLLHRRRQRAHSSTGQHGSSMVGPLGHLGTRPASVSAGGTRLLGEDPPLESTGGSHGPVPPHQKASSDGTQLLGDISRLVTSILLDDGAEGTGGAGGPSGAESESLTSRVSAVLGGAEAAQGPGEAAPDPIADPMSVAGAQVIGRIPPNRPLSAVPCLPSGQISPMAIEGLQGRTKQPAGSILRWDSRSHLDSILRTSARSSGSPPAVHHQAVRSPSAPAVHHQAVRSPSAPGDRRMGLASEFMVGVALQSAAVSASEPGGDSELLRYVSTGHRITSVSQVGSGTMTRDGI